MPRTKKQLSLGQMRLRIKKMDCTCDPLTTSWPCRCHKRLVKVKMPLERWLFICLMSFPLYKLDTGSGKVVLHEDTYRDPKHAPTRPMKTLNQQERAMILAERIERLEGLWHDDDNCLDNDGMVITPRQRKQQGSTSTERQEEERKVKRTPSLREQVLKMLVKQRRPLVQRLAEIKIDDGEEQPPNEIVRAA